MRPEYTLGDGRTAGRGDHVDWTQGFRVAPDPTRTRGTVVVIDAFHAWVQFPSCEEPFKYPLHELGRSPPSTFRAYFEQRNNAPWPSDGKEQIHVVMQRLAETLADYADELRKVVIP